MSVETLKQVKLSPDRIEAFYSSKLTNKQVTDFVQLIEPRLGDGVRKVVDIGGGRGHFARQIVEKLNLQARVLDSDERSIELCRADYGSKIECEMDDALRPRLHGDEDVVSFNLVLHHLVANSDAETRVLQKQALLAWRQQAKYLFVNEYIYESHSGDLSGRLIFEITSSPLLSWIAAKVGRFIPSLRANTVGVGVRFRSHQAWLDLFQECGLEVVDSVQGTDEPLLLARKLLLIKAMRKDSFLLVPRRASI